MALGEHASMLLSKKHQNSQDMSNSTHGPQSPLLSRYQYLYKSKHISASGFKVTSSRKQKRTFLENQAVC